MDDLEIESTTAGDEAGRAASTDANVQGAADRWNPFRGWERERLVIFWIRIALVGISTIIAIKVIQPSLVFKDTTPTGGDMGAHVWGPAYLRDHLLPWKLNGWSMDWYSGLPVYRFYMVVRSDIELRISVRCCTKDCCGRGNCYIATLLLGLWSARTFCISDSGTVCNGGIGVSA
ncbi:MAG: hypothetical protein RL628_123 [Actinomycetota bacterium]